MPALLAALSIDVDTLRDLFPGYQGPELVYDRGIPVFLEALERWGGRATFFVVGQDLDSPLARDRLRQIVAQGHELANHSQGHVQEFWRQTASEQREQIWRVHQRVADLTGIAMRGFRSPGWNHGEQTLDLLEEMGYLYDSSVMPSLLNPAIKLYYRLAGAGGSGLTPTTLGPLARMLAPLGPYRPGRPMWRRGGRGLLEIPISVDPLTRLPFFGTFLLGPGRAIWPGMLRRIARAGLPLNLEFHGVEFLDGAGGARAALDSLPPGYVPKALGMPLAAKLALFSQVLEQARQLGYRFCTLAELAAAVAPGLGLAAGQPS